MEEINVNIVDLDIDLIKTDVDRIQTRLGLDEEHVEILCEKYKEKGSAAFPLPIVFHDADGAHWLASGHYRLAAIRKALGPDDQRVVRVEVREGDMHEAAVFAASANSDHGTQLTWDEMRRLIKRILRDPKWGEMSDREIARHIGASHTFVSKEHQKLDAEDASGSGLQMPSKRKVKTRRGGKDFRTTVDNTRRGRSKKANTGMTDTPPASPAVTEVDRTVDADDVRNADHDNEDVTNDGSNDLTAVRDTDVAETHTANDGHDAATTDDYDDLKADREGDSDDDRWGVPPKGFVGLIAAWFDATADERQLFNAWANHRKIDEPAGVTTPEKHANLYLMGVDVSQVLAEVLKKRS